MQESITLLSSGNKNTGDAISMDSTMGQKFGYIRTSLGYVIKQWDNPPAGVTEEQHRSLINALKSQEECDKLYNKYKEKCNE